MKILQVIHRFPRSGGAGAENYTRHLCDALSENHDILVVTHTVPNKSALSKDYIEETTGYPYQVRSFVLYPKDIRLISNNYWIPRFNKSFTTIIKQFKPDIIHFQHLLNLSFSFIDVAHRFNIPILFTLHDYWTICPNIVMLNNKNLVCHTSGTLKCWKCHFLKYPGLQTLFLGYNYFHNRRRRIKHLLNYCDKILCPSNTLLSKIKEIGISEKKLLYWPHGIPTHEGIKTKGINEPIHKPIRFGYIGTFAHQKGLDIVLKAFLSLPNSLSAELNVWGGNISDVKNIDHCLVEKSKRVKFKGVFKQKDVWQVHNEIDVLIVPSRWYENRPLSILESFRVGNPVLGTRIGGVYELISTLGESWTFPINDVFYLKNSIIHLVENPSLIIEARKKLPYIPDMKSEAKELTKLYQSLVI